MVAYVTMKLLKEVIITEDVRRTIPTQLYSID